jgi:hypothetical protein
MKRILSLLLVFVLVISMIPTAFATRPHTQGTDVTYDASQDPDVGDSNNDGAPDNTEYYTVTVPALMNPKLGESVTGTVTLAGTWASNRVVTVALAADKVKLVNEINNTDFKELAISLTEMSFAGNNTAPATHNGTVTLAEMPADALFGTWKGVFNYNVSVADAQ